MSARAVVSGQGESSAPAHAAQQPLAQSFRIPAAEFAADLKLVQSGDGYPYYLVDASYKPMSTTLGGGWKPGLEELPPYFLTPAEVQELYAGRLGWGWRAKPGPRGNAIAILDIDFHARRQPYQELHSLGLLLKTLLDAVGLPPRHLCVSSIDDHGNGGGLHIIWLCEGLVSYEQLRALTAKGLELIQPLVNQWAAVRDTTAGFDLSPGKSNFIRFALSAHHEHARGSEPISFGPRLAASAVARLATSESGGISGNSQSKRSGLGPCVGNTAKTANAYNSTKGGRANTLSALQPSPREGSLRQGISKLLRQWEPVVFERGKSNELINKLGSACFYYGLPAEDVGGCTARQVIEDIIGRAVEDGRWHCNALPEEASDRACQVFEGLLLKGTEGYGVGLAPVRSLSIHLGLVEALLKLPVDERSVLWACYVFQQLHPGGRLEVPQTKLQAYLDLATGRTCKSYDTKAVRKIRSEHLIKPGIAVLIDPYISKERADSFEVHWPEAWLQGSTFSQEEAEDRLRLPHTYGLLAALNMEWDNTVLPTIAPPLALDADDDTAATSQDPESEDKLPEVTEECRDTEGEQCLEPLVVLEPRAEIHRPVSHHPAAGPVLSVMREKIKEVIRSADS